MAALLTAGTLAARSFSRWSLDWQPMLAFTEPWRCWSAAFVHYSAAHLTGNLLATLLVAAYGWAAQVPGRVAAAWFVAWPLMHLALFKQSDLPHYGGLSGLLHAGVATVNVYLLANGTRARKMIGAVVLSMLIVKVIGETPLQGGVQYSTDWDIPIAPIGHLSGLIVGLVCSLAAEIAHHMRSTKSPAKA